MTTKKRWTPENDAYLLDVIEVFLHDGNFIKDAFKYYAEEQGRTYEATRRRYFDIKGEDAPDLRLNGKPPKGKAKPEKVAIVEPVVDIHPALIAVSDCIKGLEAQNEAQRKTIDSLWEQNEMLSERVKQLESCESELKQLVSIIDRSRKEAFAPDTAKKYKIIDGVPAFGN